MSSPPFLLQGRVSRGVALSSCIVNINLVIKQYLAWFVYRLGRELNTLARRVRFPHRVHLLPLSALYRQFLLFWRLAVILASFEVG